MPIHSIFTDALSRIDISCLAKIPRTPDSTPVLMFSTYMDIFAFPLIVILPGPALTPVISVLMPVITPLVSVLLVIERVAVSSAVIMRSPPDMFCKADVRALVPTNLTVKSFLPPKEPFTILPPL